MTSRNGARRSWPSIEAVHVRNFRVLRDVRLDDLQRLTVLIGPNGSGKSTIIDVFAFLSDCFTDGLPRAWMKRGGMRELRSRGCEGPVVIDLKYREEPKSPLITYHLEIDEREGVPVVTHEWLQWRRKSRGRPFRFLDYVSGTGQAVAGDQPDDKAKREQQPLTDPSLLAVNTLGQFKSHPRVAALRHFIAGWHLSFLEIPRLKYSREAGPETRLSKSGGNLANVLQHIQKSDPDRLVAVFSDLARRVPQLERVTAQELRDGSLLLQLKDRGFEDPVMAQFVSDGTLKLLAYLILLSDPDPPPLVGIEEPENFVHPALLQEIGESYLGAAVRTQLFVTTHAPSLLNSLHAMQVRVLSRDDQGFTRVRTAGDIPGILDFLNEGGHLGVAWQQNLFDRPDLPAHAR